MSRAGPPRADSVAAAGDGAAPTGGGGGSSDDARAGPLADVASASIVDVLATLRVDPGNGLDSREVEARLSKYGYNEVLERRPHPLRRFARKFWGVSAWMLELILVLSAALRKYADFTVVAALLVINALLGFLQEHRAAGVVEALRRRLQVGARALRDGAWHRIDARELVPGDIVRLRAGDIVPADARLLAGTLSVDQSALTGESRDIAKAAGDVLPSGSTIRRGEGNAVIVLTGARTYFGRTTELVQSARPRLHIEAVVAQVVRWLFVIVGAVLAGVTALSLVGGGPLVELVALMLVLLMSAVPIALPVMFTVSMAVGSRELASRGVLVTRLSAAEDAATMDVLCVDKTGTITRNELAVAAVIPEAGVTESEVVLAGSLASEEANQDPIDLAFLAAAKERGVLSAAISIARIAFTPFAPERRRTEAIVDQDGRRFRVVKGAMRSVADLCEAPASAIEAWERRAAEWAAKGYRVLAVAKGPETGPPALLGFVTLHDPPRPDAAPLLTALRALGIRVTMLTGDALAIAREVGKGVGLPNIRRAAELRSHEAERGLESLDVFADADGLAEVYPEDKYLVVQRLQAAGHVTGMTGDGINDAPALRQAEVGIAVSSATDVARAAASVVLTQPGLTDIVALVEQGRTIYQRILTWIINKISRTILKAAFVAVAFVVTGKFVVSAFAMLLLVFMTDFAKIALATDHVRPSRTPETWRIGGYVAVSAALGIALTAEALVLLFACWSRFDLASNEPALHTFSFLTLLYLAVFSLVSARERRWFFASKPSRTLVAALATDILVGTSLTLAGLPDLPDLQWWQTGSIFVYCAGACLVVNDPIKVALFRRLLRAQSPT